MKKKPFTEDCEITKKQLSEIMKTVQDMKEKIKSLKNTKTEKIVNEKFRISNKNLSAKPH